jgi:CXXX repeat peptide maturase
MKKNKTLIIGINLGDYGSTGTIMRNALEYANKNGNYDYLIIVPKDRGKRLIDIDDLKRGIRHAMMENLMIQFIYPKEKLPSGYIEVLNSIDHIDIRPYTEDETVDSEVAVFNELPLNLLGEKYPKTVFRLTPQEFFDFPYYLAKEVFQKVERLNIVIRDIDPILAWNLERYKKKVNMMAGWIKQEYLKGNSPQWNLLTDRMMLSKMNNCDAGVTSITLAPNGKFYICPAFYYENEADSIGDLEHGLDIKNKQLYRLDHAPICSHCDAWQCKRCVWLNRKTTVEVNTPSHEQCVVSHLERNASRELLSNIRKHGTFLPEQDEIKEIDYLDPFDKRNEWQ